jgi:hypothetical protein
VEPELLGRSADLNKEGRFGISVVVAGSIDTRVARSTVRNESITGIVQEPVGANLHRSPEHDDEDGDNQAAVVAGDGRSSQGLQRLIHASGHGTKEHNSIVAD